MAGLIEPMVGAADALDHPRGALGAGELDDEVDVTPVDAEIQGRGANDGAQGAARHRRLDPAPLLGGKRPVMQGNGQAVLVQPPELLEGELGLEAGVDENQRRARPPDRLVDLWHGVSGGVADPRHLPLREQHVHHRRRSAGSADEVDLRLCAGREPSADHVRILHRGREADTAVVRREGEQARHVQRQQVAALGWPDRVDLVDDHAGEVLEIEPRPFPGAEQRQLLGRGQQDVGRLDPLALAPGDPRVAGARLGGHLQAHLGDRRHQVALDVYRQRLERRDVERVDAARRVGRRPRGQVDQAGQEPRQGLAPAGRRDEEGVAALATLLDHRQLMRSRRPPPLGEPVGEAGREQGRGAAVHRRRL